MSLGCTSEGLFASILSSMHVPDHESVLPEHVDPIPMPDSSREAELLVLLLDVGVYPKLVPSENGNIPAVQGDSPMNLS